MTYRPIGGRRAIANFSRHNGNQDSHGAPTYDTPEDWSPIGFPLPVEIITATAGETVRGRQVTAETTQVLYSEYSAGSMLRATDRVSIESFDEAPPIKGGVVYVFDPDGLRREIRIEIKQEVE